MKRNEDLFTAFIAGLTFGILIGAVGLAFALLIIGRG